jgi:hypothetical protein
LGEEGLRGLLRTLLLQLTRSRAGERPLLLATVATGGGGAR